MVLAVNVGLSKFIQNIFKQSEASKDAKSIELFIELLMIAYECL